MKKLSFTHHKIILTTLLVILLLIGLILGFQIAMLNQGSAVISAVMFGILFLIAFMTFFLASMLLRVRDDIHNIKNDVYLEMSRLKRIMLTINDVFLLENKKKSKKRRRK